MSPLLPGSKPRRGKAEVILDNSGVLSRYCPEFIGSVESGCWLYTIGNGYSEHFRHAVVTTAFAAFAVERAMTELIWIECFLITSPSERWKGVLLASRLRNIPDKLEFLSHKGLSQEQRKSIQILFERRNQLAHLRNSTVITHTGGALNVEDLREILEQAQGSDLRRLSASVSEYPAIF